GDAADASVAIGDHESAADRDLEARENEEAKRLLYVALTRARDRLYLAATLNAEKRLNAGKGGLGKTLPETVGALFAEAAAADGNSIAWHGPTAPHRVCIVQPWADMTAVVQSEADSGPRSDDFEAIPAASPPR